jgi:hypothetical protein
MPVVISNEFAAQKIAPLWFYSLLSNFMQTRQKTSLWEGSLGAVLLSQVFTLLATIVDCAGPNQPGTGLLARDLFHLVWGFRQAHVPEVRRAVLGSVVTVATVLPRPELAQLLSSEKGFGRALHEMSLKDGDENCRELALAIQESAVGDARLLTPTSLWDEGS